MKGVVIYAASPPAIPAITAFSLYVKSLVGLTGLKLSYKTL